MNKHWLCACVLKRRNKVDFRACCVALVEKIRKHHAPLPDVESHGVLVPIQMQPPLLIPGAITRDLADVVCRFLIDRFHDRHIDLVNFTELDREACTCLSVLLRKYHLVPTDMDDWLEEVIERLEEERDQARARTFEAFSLRCPYCGHEGNIKVTSAILSATSLMIYPNAPLYADGFDIYDMCGPEERDLSTESERVQCLDCHMTFDLNELFLS